MIFDKYRLEDIADKIGDGIHGTPKYDETGDYYFVNGNNLIDGDIVFKNDTKRIDEEQYLKNKRDLNMNTLLVSINGTLGNVAKYNNEKIILGKSACYINIKNNYNVDYVYFVFKSPKFKQYLQYGANGTTIKNVPLSAIRNYEISIPSKTNQDKIVKILKNIEDKIKLNNKLNNNLHEVAENLFKCVYEKGKKCKLEELISNVSTGSRPKGGAQISGIPSIGAEKIEKFGIYNYSSEKYISEEYFNKLKTGIIKSGDVLLYKDGAYTGKVSMALNGFPHDKCAANEHVFIINTEDNWAKYYLYFTLYNQENRNKIFTMASSKAAQPGLNQSELKALDIKLADKKEIIKFEKKVESIMFKIAHNTLQNKILERLRDTLLPKLMNGKIDLDNIEI